jgi:hypothetical protein
MRSVVLMVNVVMMARSSLVAKDEVAGGLVYHAHHLRVNYLELTVNSGGPFAGNCRPLS